MHSILIVDDNDTNLNLLAKILEIEGYQVTKARTASEAIRKVIDRMPDLIILDVMMPDMNGYDLCRTLLRSPLGVTNPIVMLTALNAEEDRKKALEAGAADILSKPFDMDVFTSRISEYLQETPARSMK